MMYAVVIYEFDDEKYAEMLQSKADPEVIMAQIAHAASTQGRRQITLYIANVELDDIIEAVQCIL